jgi:hypothetical protein
MKACSLGFFAVFLFSFIVFSQDKLPAGSVLEKNAQAEELTLSMKQLEGLAGHKFYLMINGKPVILVTTFSMTTKPKARLYPGFKKYFNDIKIGEKVYLYTSDIEAKINYTELQDQGSVNDLVMLCGKSFTDEKVKTFMTLIGDGYIPRNPNTNLLTDMTSGGDSRSNNVELVKHQFGYYYLYKKKGISFKFDNMQGGLILSEILLYNQDANSYNKYPLSLPENISFNETRSEIEKKIGQPIKSGGEGKIPFWASYSHLGFVITYKSESTTDMNNQIFSISIKRF